ncbi:MAG: Spy/CpxP family protein refolding chaperone [Thiobacillus sp.]
MDRKKNGFWIALWVILVVITGFLAFGYGSRGMAYGPWHGGSRMGAWHDDYRAGSAPDWRGMGPGMMGGVGGMMTGMGAGMGFGMPSVMMLWLPPDLTSEQTGAIGKLQAESAQRSLDIMRQHREAQARLNDLYAAERRDWNAIRAASLKLFELQRQQLDASIDMQQKIDGLLTDSQRRQMARDWRGYGWMGAQ